MNDRNRIIDPGQLADGGQPIKMDMANEPGFITMSFSPPVVRMRLRPKEARALALSMLIHAEQAETPPPTIEEPKS